MSGKNNINLSNSRNFVHGNVRSGDDVRSHNTFNGLSSLTNSLDKEQTFEEFIREKQRQEEQQRKAKLLFFDKYFKLVIPGTKYEERDYGKYLQKKKQIIREVQQHYDHQFLYSKMESRIASMPIPSMNSKLYLDHWFNFIESGAYLIDNNTQNSSPHNKDQSPDGKDQSPDGEYYKSKYE